MFAIVTLIAMYSSPAPVQTLRETVVVSDTVVCSKRDLVQGSGSVVTCERK